MYHRCSALILVGLCLGMALGGPSNLPNEVHRPHSPPPQPATPQTYQALIRYQILAYRTERLRQYAAMMEAFKEVGFVRDPDEVIADDEPDNPKATRLRGTLPAKNVDRFLALPAVRSVLLFPAGTKLPAKDARARVDIRLPSGYIPDVQRNLHRQTAEVLTKDAGFIEAVGYDHRGFSRLVGSMPGQDMDKLVEDIRQLPSAEDLAGPFRSVSSVIRKTIVRPDWPVPTGLPAPAVVPENLRKISPELRSVLADAALGDKPARMEVILGWTPASVDLGWRKVVESAGAVPEGRLGPLVTVLGVPKVIAPRLAERPEVVAVRLPRAGKQVAPGRGGDVPANWEPLRASGLAKIHALNRRGKDTRVAVIADDFAGWEKLKGRKAGKTALPDPKLIDLTAERNQDLLPDPYPNKDQEGYGTRCARALLRAAPEAELTLIRIDARAPYMLQTVARAINCEPSHTISLDQRGVDLRVERAQLEQRRDQIRAERKEVLDNVTGDEEGDKVLRAFQKKQAAIDAELVAQQQRETRYYRLISDLQQLKGVRLVASTLVWVEGYPVDGSSSLSRYFDDRPFKAALWFQAAGDSGGQAWTGMFRDADHNGIMEFVAPRTPMLPAGSWSGELNFLGWLPASGSPTSALPAGARMRVSLQWREAHDPLPLRAGDDLYREPLAQLNLVVVYQPDPEGKARPADDLEVVARSAGSAVRLNQTSNSATYEHLVEFQANRPGRYAVFIEGRPPASTQAPGEASLPVTRKVSEIYPRLFVQTLEGAGRAVWGDFATSQAALGMPADAQGVIAVAAIDELDRLRPTSAGGPPAGQTLSAKPELLAYDDGGGTAEAASFAAGFAASAWPVTGTLCGVLDRLRLRPGDVLRVPTLPRRE